MKISNKQIKKTAIIESQLDKIWWQWTTHEGLLTFLGNDNRIELTPGGKYEIYFLMENPRGLRGGEGNTVLSFLPKRMLSFTWNAPPKFPEVRASSYRTWVVVNFEPVSGSQTRVNLTHLGWPISDKWDQVYEYFDEAWDFVMNWLKESAYEK